MNRLKRDICSVCNKICEVESVDTSKYTETTMMLRNRYLYELRKEQQKLIKKLTNIQFKVVMDAINHSIELGMNTVDAFKLIDVFQYNPEKAIDISLKIKYQYQN